MTVFNHDIYQLSALSQVERQVVLRKKGRPSHYRQLVVYNHAPDQFTLVYFAGTAERMEMTESRTMEIKFYVNNQINKFIDHWEDEGYYLEDRIVENFHYGAIGKFCVSESKRYNLSSLKELSNDTALISIPFGQRCVIEIGYSHAFSVNAFKASSGTQVQLGSAEKLAFQKMLQKNEIDCLLLEGVITSNGQCVLLDILQMNNVELAQSFTERHMWLSELTPEPILVGQYKFLEDINDLRAPPKIKAPYDTFGFITKENASQKQAEQACFGFIPQYYLIRVYQSELIGQDSYKLKRQDLKRVQLSMVNSTGGFMHVGEMVCPLNATFSVVATTGFKNNCLIAPAIFSDKDLAQFLEEDTSDVLKHLESNWYLNVEEEYRESVNSNNYQS